MRSLWHGWLLVLLLAVASFGIAAEASSVKLAVAGKPVVKVFVAGTPEQLGVAAPAVADLQRVLQKMVGTPYESVVGPFADTQAPGIYVGTAADFAGFGVEIPRDLDTQELVVKTAGNGRLLLIGGGAWGISHAIDTFLDNVGCRWYYMGDAWEVVPQQPNLTVSLDLCDGPDFYLQRHIWAGAGMHSSWLKTEFANWQRRNRMGKPIRITTSHSWPGIDPEKDFQAHPEWFGLVKGERKNSKPCYAHPEVIQRGIQRALDYFRNNPTADMITVSAPDGTNYCECERCMALAGVKEIYELQGTPFGKTADGREVSLPSETIFNYANQVATAVAKEFPGKYVGCLAYSCYAHPPSFTLEPNIYVEITRGYRRTPLTQSEQIAEFAKKAKMLGIYEYLEVQPWTWEKPGRGRAAKLDYLASMMPYYYDNNMRSLNAEMSLNFAPNGVGYFITSRLLWDYKTDIRAAEEELYRLAFGPAEAPMKRLYRRWESGQSMDERTTALAYRDLQEAAQLTANQPEYRTRVDLIRMYAHFLRWYLQPKQYGTESQDVARWTEQFGTEEAKRRVEYQGVWVSRLMDTGMVHSWPFNRTFMRRGNLLGCDTKNWMKPGPIPTGEEIERLFQQDLQGMKLDDAKEVPYTLFGNTLVPLPKGVPGSQPGTAPVLLNIHRANILNIKAAAGQKVEITCAEDLPADTAARARFVGLEDYEKGLAEMVVQVVDGVAAGRTLTFTSPGIGYLRVSISAPLVKVSAPTFLSGDLNLMEARLYFYVPRGTPRFLLRTSADKGPTFTVKDAKGTVVLNTANAREREFLIEVPAGTDGAVWSFEGPKDVNGTASVQLIGVPNYYSLQPEQLLVPEDALLSKQ
ncbi:MAG: DUF4838 domain-containing protein [Armatimonadota bacterium]